jgi:hypothetical protein
MAGRSVGARLGGLRRLAAQRRPPAPPRLATSWWPLLQGDAATTVA